MLESCHPEARFHYTRERMSPSSARPRTPLLAVAWLAVGIFSVPEVGWTGGGPQPVPVTTAELGSVLIFRTHDAPAIAVTLNDTRLAAETTGVVAAIPVQVGDRVSTGEVVARVDCEQHRIAVASAEAALEAGKISDEFNQRQLEKARKLSTSRNISQEELDKRSADARRSQAEVNRLHAGLDEAERSTSKCEITAPFNAVVIERVANLGDYVVPGTQILRLVDDDHIEVSAKVQEQDLRSLIEATDPVFVSLNQSYPVKLRTVLPLMESRLRSYEVRLTFVAAKSAPGTPGRLQWKEGRGEVPPDLIVRRGNELGIFVSDGGTAHFMKLSDAQQGHPAPVDLPAHTRVIRDGRFSLHDGDSVSEQ